MNIKTYQEIQLLDATKSDYVSDVGTKLNIDSSLPYKEAYDEIIRLLDVKPKEIIQKKYLIGNKIYFYEKDLLSCSFEQFSRLDMLLSLDKNTENMHKLLAIYFRPANLFKNKISKFNLDNQDEISEHIQNNMDIEDAASLILFFYQLVSKYMNYINSHYSQMMIQNQQKKQEEHTKSKLMV